MKKIVSKEYGLEVEKNLKMEYDEKERLIIDPGIMLDEIYDSLLSNGFGDGLPIIPPTRERVERMIEYTDRNSQDIIGYIPHRGLPATVEKLAITAVMSGCKPEYFPVFLTAIETICDKNFDLGNVALTSYPSCLALVVSGPIADEIGMNSGEGCLGPGNRANATIGRAVNLALINIGGIRIGVNYHAVHSTPAKYSYCFAEDIKSNPWTPLNAETSGKDNTVTLAFAGEGPYNVGLHAEYRRGSSQDVLYHLAKAAVVFGSNPIYFPSDLLIIISPVIAELLTRDGWSKSGIKQFIYENARMEGHSSKFLRRFGPGYNAWGRVKWAFKEKSFPVVTNPDDIILVIAGARDPHGMLSLPWGVYSRATRKAVTLKNGEPAKSIKEFRK